MTDESHDATSELIRTAADRLDELATEHTTGTIQLAADLRQAAQQ